MTTSWRPAELDRPTEDDPAYPRSGASLRAALDAAVLSPAGLAVAVDGDGRVAGVATFDQLRAAIQAAEGRSRQLARQVQPASEAPPP